MHQKSKAFLDRVIAFYASNNFQTEKSAAEWIYISQAIRELTLEEMIDAFEDLTKLILASQKNQATQGLRSEINPLSECHLKLQKMMAAEFWAKVIEIDFLSPSEEISRLHITELVAQFPQLSRSAIKHSLIDAQTFPLAHFASACLQQPAQDLFF